MGDPDPTTPLACVVTGGASGIGAATVALLAARGDRVASLDRSYDGVTEVTAELLTIGCDVSDTRSAEAAVDAAASAYGGIDVLVSNAGIGAVGDVTDNSDEEWHRVLDVNVVGMARVTRAALPWLRRSGRASVVLTGSVVASVGVPQRALYSASKGAVASLALAMAADHVREGIRVNAVMPGTADTPWVARLLEQAADSEAAETALRNRQPIGRLVTAEEVAQAIVYLASPLSGSTTGTLLAVDGGMAGLRLPT